jgi:hypothetical protein
VQPSQPAESGGLLSGLNNLFKPQSQAEPEAPQAAPSKPSLESSAFEPLSAESERILASVPETIGGGEADDPGGPADVPNQDPIAALMAQVAFDPQDVQDTLAEMFDWMAERFQSDHWRLTERQARMGGRPAAMMLNAIWTKLQSYIPDMLSKWCEATPGATAFFLWAGIVVGPKAMKQFSLSRERSKAKPRVPAPQPAAPAQPQQRPTQPGGPKIVWNAQEVQQ